MSSEIAALVDRAQQGDRDAFAELVESYRRVAAGVAYGILGDPHLAADAVQDAFFKAFRGLSSLKDSERFSSWFLAIVRSTATDLARKRTRWGVREVAMGDAIAEGSSTPRPGPQDALLQGEEANRIRDAMMALSDEYREVILLKHIEGHSYREIARLLKTSVRAVESRLFRARQQLHRMLHGESDGRSET